MKIKKMSFESLQNELSAEEMRCIMAGSGFSGGSSGGWGGPGPGFPGGTGSINLNEVVITPNPGSNYVIYPPNPSIPGGTGNGTGGGYYPGSSGGSGGSPGNPNYNYDDKPIDMGRNYIRDFERGSLSWQHYSEKALTHTLTQDETSFLSDSAAKLMTAFGVAVDSHNFTTALVSFMSAEADVVLKVANKTTGIVGIALGGIAAANNIYKNGGNTGDWIAIGLSLASVAVIGSPFGAATTAGASLIVSALSFTNDAVSIAGGYQ